jgi:hypothetical protein
MSQPRHRLSPSFGTAPKPWRCQSASLLSLFLAGLFLASPASAQPTNSLKDQIIDLQMEMDKAIGQVQKIVNQPVTRLARNPEVSVGTYSPGWFHEGANKPDFNNVDIRTTQEKIYDKHSYVTSDLNPGVVFIGRELEFNANTKYFYTDRSLPKKKLTEAEMLEINRLYRIIGRCEQQLAQLQAPTAATETTETTETVEGNTAYNVVARYPLLKSTAFRAALVVAVLLGAVYLFRRRTE